MDTNRVKFCAVLKGNKTDKIKSNESSTVLNSTEGRPVENAFAGC